MTRWSRVAQIYDEVWCLSCCRQRDAFKTIDSKPESTVLVSGSDVTALFNFLLNSTSLAPVAGELAGVPPTLLSPSPFKGATVTSLTLRQNCLRQQQLDGTVGKAYSLELIGPVLPGAFEQCCVLFESTQKRNFTSASQVLDSSVALNAAKTPRPLITEFATEDAEAERTRALPVRVGAGVDGRHAVRDLQCCDRRYSWT